MILRLRHLFVNLHDHGKLTLASMCTGIGVFEMIVQEFINLWDSEYAEPTKSAKGRAASSTIQKRMIVTFAITR